MFGGENMDVKVSSSVDTQKPNKFLILQNSEIASYLMESEIIDFLVFSNY